MASGNLTAAGSAGIASRAARSPGALERMARSGDNRRPGVCHGAETHFDDERAAPQGRLAAQRAAEAGGDEGSAPPRPARGGAGGGSGAAQGAARAGEITLGRVLFAMPPNATLSVRTYRPTD